MAVAEKNQQKRVSGIPVPELRRRRRKHGWTVRKLSDETGVAVSTITALENNHRGAQGGTLQKLAKALGVNAEELIGNALDG